MTSSVLVSNEYLVIILFSLYVKVIRLTSLIDSTVIFYGYISLSSGCFTTTSLTTLSNLTSTLTAFLNIYLLITVVGIIFLVESPSSFSITPPWKMGLYIGFWSFCTAKIYKLSVYLWRIATTVLSLSSTETVTTYSTAVSTFFVTTEIVLETWTDYFFSNTEMTLFTTTLLYIALVSSVSSVSIPLMGSMQ